MYSRILAANDGSPGSLKALDTAIELARQVSAELHMVTVEELPRFPASIDEVAEEKDEANHRFAPIIAAAKAQASASGVKIETPSCTRPRGRSDCRTDQRPGGRSSRRGVYGPLAALRADHSAALQTASSDRRPALCWW